MRNHQFFKIVSLSLLFCVLHSVNVAGSPMSALRSIGQYALSDNLPFVLTQGVVNGDMFKKEILYRLVGEEYSGPGQGWTERSGRRFAGVDVISSLVMFKLFNMISGHDTDTDKQISILGTRLTIRAKYAKLFAQLSAVQLIDRVGSRVDQSKRRSRRQAGHQESLRSSASGYEGGNDRTVISGQNRIPEVVEEGSRPGRWKNMIGMGQLARVITGIDQQELLSLICNKRMGIEWVVISLVNGVIDKCSK